MIRAEKYVVTQNIHSRFSVLCVKVRQSDKQGKRGFHHNIRDFREESITGAKGSILYF